jgi:RNA polymerase sigma-70 factor (ECF subfamily)
LIDHLFRTESGRLVALLVRLLGPAHLALAEDVTQEAFVAALQHWPHTGIPDTPAAWLLQVARRKALDALRRDRSLDGRAARIAAEFEQRASLVASASAGIGDALDDEQLGLMFLCCHPAISEDSRVALTLRTVSGFSIGEIARAFLADERSVAQRLVRAKRSLRDTDADFALPEGADLRARMDAVLGVLYLMFNEGHTAHEGEELLRRDLCYESLRLAKLLVRDPRTVAPRVHALAALICFHAARLDARTDASGRLVRLRDQDRARWDAGLIGAGLRHLEQSAGGDELTAYHLEAEIASCHCTACTPEDTNWPRILEAYDRLSALTGSPVVALNRVVALHEVSGPRSAMEALEQLADVPALQRYHAYHGVRADLHTALGTPHEAAAAWRDALACARSGPVRRFIQGRLAALGAPDVDFAGPHPS